MTKQKIGIYETIRCQNLHIYNFTAHYNRLKKGAKYLNIPFQVSKLELKNQILEKLKLTKYSKTRIRINFYTNRLEIESYEIFNTNFKPRLITFLGQRPIPKIKNIDRTLEDKALKSAQSKNAIDAILVDKKGSLTEGSISNLFVVINNILITPKNNILAGTMRKQVIQIAKKLKIPIQYSNLKLSEIPTFQEIFITNAIKGLVPIYQIDNIKLLKKNPITQKILSQLLHSQDPTTY